MLGGICILAFAAVWAGLALPSASSLLRTKSKPDKVLRLISTQPGGGSRTALRLEADNSFVFAKSAAVPAVPAGILPPLASEPPAWASWAKTIRLCTGGGLGCFLFGKPSAGVSTAGFGSEIAAS